MFEKCVKMKNKEGAGWKTAELQIEREMDPETRMEGDKTNESGPTSVLECNFQYGSVTLGLVYDRGSTIHLENTGRSTQSRWLGDTCGIWPREELKSNSFRNSEKRNFLMEFHRTVVQNPPIARKGFISHT